MINNNIIQVAGKGKYFLQLYVEVTKKKGTIYNVYYSSFFLRVMLKDMNEVWVYVGHTRLKTGRLLQAPNTSLHTQIRKEPSY